MQKEMRKIIVNILALFLFINPDVISAADTMMFGAFGKVTIYQPATSPVAIVLFVSGDGGWNKGVVDMAENIVA